MFSETLRHRRGVDRFWRVGSLLAAVASGVAVHAAAAEPFKTALVTTWGAEVTPENAWREYPRPQMQRDGWTCLNGHWDYAVTPKTDSQPPADWSGKILVPFALESRLGGVQRLLAADEALWYRRPLPATPQQDRLTWLNFEAVDYRCDVYVNGQHVGQHQGGHTPFRFDITAALKPSDNTLLVRVTDDTEAWQLRGKQVLKPESIWYTQMSGIWQTVWLEQTPATHLTGLKIHTDAAKKSITLRPQIAGQAAGKVSVTVRDGDQVVGQAQTAAGEAATITVANAKLWSPDSPHLYDLDVALLDGQGKTIDRVRSYAGIRTVGKARDAQGHWRFTLNGQEVFHWGPLDQGWWPDGLLTPPSDAAMAYDIEFLKAAGFNMIRKHIKVEPRRYYYHCDRLGIMLWQDQVSGGKNPPWTRLKPDPQDADWPEEHHQQYMTELERMVDLLENHPSIVVWVPFNEAWGQHRTVEVGRWLAQRDPTRLVNVASGGNFWPVGDVVDSHNYPHPGDKLDDPSYADYVKVIGEFGGHGLVVADHVFDAGRKNWGYSLAKTTEELAERYRESLKRLNDLRKLGIAAGVYTQTTDVEGEVNGLLTYDRQVAKLPAEDLKAWSRPLVTGD